MSGLKLYTIISEEVLAEDPDAEELEHANRVNEFIAEYESRGLTPPNESDIKTRRSSEEYVNVNGQETSLAENGLALYITSTDEGEDE